MTAELPRGARLDGGALGVLARAVIDNPWSQLVEMATWPVVWQPIDLEAGLPPLQRSISLNLREREPPDAIEGRVMNMSSAFGGIYVPEARFDDPATARAALERLLGALPPEADGRIALDGDTMQGWYERHGIAPLPELFGDAPPWLVAWSRGTWARLGERADVLGIPAVEVAERGDRIWIQLHDEPFDVDSDATRTRIARIGDHVRRIACR